MMTRVSSKGQVVLPKRARSQLRLVSGTKLVCEVHGDSIVLTPEPSRMIEKEYVVDALTGLRVTKARPGTERITTEIVGALLEDFP